MTRRLVSTEELGELDSLYEERSPSGRPTSWGALVEGLREIRRAVEAGTVVEVRCRNADYMAEVLRLGARALPHARRRLRLLDRGRQLVKRSSRQLDSF
jgi:hypothetical protein